MNMVFNRSFSTFTQLSPRLMLSHRALVSSSQVHEGRTGTVGVLGGRVASLAAVRPLLSHWALVWAHLLRVQLGSGRRNPCRTKVPVPRREMLRESRIWKISRRV